ncbi:MAG: amidohydrolase family protein [Candidatus Lokiarchaeota archaeon]|nr:amidohydrolase family protein [Candidatus Lokiarchaeota archaeon]
MSLLIKNGIIIDGTGSDGYKKDILIAGDTIKKIDDNIESEEAEIVDASGKIVSPGFIDIHNHADLTILNLPKIEAYILQGCTTITGGHCGFGITPANDLVKKYYYNLASKLLSVKPELCEDLGAFREKIEDQGISINLAYFIPQGNVRALKFGAAEKPANQEEIKYMQNVIRENMEAGAFGMTTGLVYPPGSVTETEELIKLSKVVGEYDGVYMSHMRNEGAHVVDIGMNELIRIAREANCRAHISHWSVISSAVERMTPKVIEVMENAHDEGLDITADVTVYEDGVTPLAFILLNPWVFEDFEKNLTNPETRKRILNEIFQKIFDMFIADGPWYIRIIPKFLLKRIIFPKLSKEVKILSCPVHTEIQGKTIFEALKGLYPDKNIQNGLLDLLRDEEGGVIITLNTKDEEKGIIPLFKKHYVAASSDGILVVNPDQNEHPRNYGTFPRVIHRWVREMECVSLEEAIRKITSLPAEILGIKDRGILKEGYKADITIFDYENIREKGTLENGRQFPEGIDYVIVNGKITADHGEHIGTLNGKLLKYNK